jgi:FMN phosphatase YigB (HAD superfamily)
VEGLAAVSRPASPEGLTFDVWYTLLYLPHSSRHRYEAARDAAWQAALTRAGVPPDQATAGRRRLAAEVRRREAGGRAFSLAAQARWVAGAGRIDVRRLERALAAAVGLLEVRLAPGALGLLERLRASGRAVGLVSNVVHEPPREIHRILERTGIRRRVDTVILSNEYGWAKPSDRPIRAALRKMGVPPAQSLHLGDTDYDILAAWRAGSPAARYVGLRRFWPPAPPRPRGLPAVRVPRVAGWADLPGSLDRLWLRAVHAAQRARQASA